MISGLKRVAKLWGCFYRSVPRDKPVPGIERAKPLASHHPEKAVRIATPCGPLTESIIEYDLYRSEIRADRLELNISLVLSIPRRRRESPTVAERHGLLILSPSPVLNRSYVSCTRNGSR